MRVQLRDLNTLKKRVGVYLKARPAGRISLVWRLWSAKRRAAGSRAHFALAIDPCAGKNTGNTRASGPAAFVGSQHRFVRPVAGARVCQLIRRICRLSGQ
jgi:hypothetical protein